MKKFLLIALFCGCTTLGFSQQLEEYTQWYWNQFALNPAHAGIRECVEVKAQYRFQYTGVEGAPDYGNFSVSFPIRTRRRTFLTPRQGIGLKLSTERIGAFMTNTLNLSYAAHLNFTQDNRISVGIDAGIRQLAVNLARITTEDYDPTVHEYASNWMPDVNIGFWWNTKNYYIGLMGRELLGSKWKKIGLESKYFPHIYLNGGYRFAFNHGFSFYPQAMMKLPIRGKFSTDFVLVFDHNNQISYSVGFRTSEAIMAGFKFTIKEMFSIGDLFDYVFKPLGGFANSTHELNIMFSGCKSYKKTTTGCDLF